MKLKKLLEHIENKGLSLESILTKHAEVELMGLCIDSRSVQDGDAFLAYPGFASDGRDYISDAITNGAVVVLKQADAISLDSSQGVPVISIPDLREKVGELASQFYGFPSHALTVVGITGTNGKTSCLHFMADLLTHLGCKVGTVGTLGLGLFPDITPGALTTPDAVTLHKVFRQLLDQGATHVVMEVSSHSLDQGRVAGVQFDYAVFTNMSRDHLDYHQTFDAYIRAKRKLFELSSLKAAVFNCDDKVGKTFASEFNNQYGVYGFQRSDWPVEGDSHYHAEFTQDGVTLSWADLTVFAPILGQFNSENIAAVVVTLRAMGFDSEAIAKAANKLKSVPGRMQLVRSDEGKPLCIVDYAHTPDALEKLLVSAKDYLGSGGRLVCVFGCGGDRDTGKRGLMAKVASKLADSVVVTSDNPRTECPEKIINDILKGMSASIDYVIEPDRSMAIKQAVALAEPKDVVVVAGKGHEKYQMTAKGRQYFDDCEEISAALKEYVESK